MKRSIRVAATAIALALLAAHPVLADDYNIPDGMGAYGEPLEISGDGINNAGDELLDEHRQGGVSDDAPDPGYLEPLADGESNN